MQRLKIGIVFLIISNLFSCSSDKDETADPLTMNDVGGSDRGLDTTNINPGLFAIDSIEASDECLGFAPNVESLLVLGESDLSIENRIFPKVSDGFFGCEVGELDAFGIPRSHEQTIIKHSVETETGVEFTFSITSFDRRTKRACEGFSIKARRLGECALEGNFETTAIEKSGNCDISWESSDVKFIKNENGLLLDWNGFSSEVKKQAEGCAFDSKKGLENEVWGFNGAERQTELTWKLVGNLAEVSVSDQVEGTMLDNTTCESATFEISLARKTGLEDPRLLPAECSSPAPPICGDGVCAGRKLRCM